MSHQKRAGNPPLQIHRGKPGRNQRDKGRTGLKRLPSNYCWRLLRALLDTCSDQLSAELYNELYSLFRIEDAPSYYGLDAQLGLQCMSDWVNPMRGNPAVIHMLVSAFRKCADLELVPARERRERCLANVRLIDDAIPAVRQEWLTDDVYVYARRWLAHVLGSVPSTDAIQLSSRHGPGSTASIAFGERSKYFKLADLPYRTGPSCRSQLVDCVTADVRWTSALEDYLRRRDGAPMWAVLDRLSVELATVDGGHPYNIITTVPKDGRKDRPIAKEQTGSIYLQLGVGQLIRSRLRGVGVDLDKQAEINRRMALESSQTQEHFTIDLSNASDTVGYDLVKAMLPSGWFELLDSLRAPWGVLPTGEAFLYRKFSSMGNGFTFELETLIFLALCKGVQRSFGCRTDRFVAFGDDILGPDYLYVQTRNYLEYSGFQVNSEKSFHGKSRVRESCGVDGLDGINIRPVFVKCIPTSVMEGVGLRNRLRAWFYRTLGDYPAKLDNLLIGDTFESLPPVGPDSDVEFDGWLQDGYWAEGTRHKALTASTAGIPAREFHLRKLMHDLRSCSGEGGNFLVSEVSERVRLVDRVVGSQFCWLTDS